MDIDHTQMEQLDIHMVDGDGGHASGTNWQRGGPGGGTIFIYAKELKQLGAIVARGGNGRF